MLESVIAPEAGEKRAVENSRRHVSQPG
jgi:hypothetical protein